MTKASNKPMPSGPPSTETNAEISRLTDDYCELLERVMKLEKQMKVVGLRAVGIPSYSRDSGHQIPEYLYDGKLPEAFSLRGGKLVVGDLKTLYPEEWARRQEQVESDEVWERTRAECAERDKARNKALIKGFSLLAICAVLGVLVWKGLKYVF